MAYLQVVYDPFRLISTWFAWISYRISRNCFFFSNIFSNFRNRPWLEFPFIFRYLHWTPKAKHLKWLEQRSQNHQQEVAHFPLARVYCAKRLRYWDQQYYCNHAQYLFPGIFQLYLRLLLVKNDKKHAI